MPCLCVERKEEAVRMVGANGLAYKSIRGNDSGNVHIREREMLEKVPVATWERTEGRQSSNRTMLRWLYVVIVKKGHDDSLWYLDPEFQPLGAAGFVWYFPEYYEKELNKKRLTKISGDQKIKIGENPPSLSLCNLLFFF